MSSGHESPEQHQLSFDSPGEERVRPERMGGAAIAYRDATSILTPTSGFMKSYDYTLNPYSGCAFGCSYCYAAFFAQTDEQRDSWGEWVVVKENAIRKLAGMRKDLRGAKVYMSSVTDPYQPIEGRLELVRDLLPELSRRGVHLYVQTRSPLVARDIDLFATFEDVQVNMTVTTDEEDVRKAFEPRCPANDRRLEAISEVAAAGIRTMITMTPLLPVRDPGAFAERLQATGASKFVVQPFHVDRGRFVRGTREAAMQVTESMGWNIERYREVVGELRRHLPNLAEGQDGFAPE